MTSEIVQQGRAAWARLKKNGGNWDDWKTVGYALLEGRATAMHNAGAIRPAGRGYTSAFSDWLRYNGFDMSSWDRANLITLMGILPEIEQWRATLSFLQRLRSKSPGAVLQSYRKAFGSRPTSEHVPRSKAPA